jgi:2,3-bisphosphoglycerate-independent phosphoglycerate mutase
MCEYDASFGLAVAFAPADITETLADVLAEHGCGQLHVAETEKYAHVTYFFNGGVETIHDHEFRALAESPRDVPTYDHKPEMAAAEVARLFEVGFASDDVDFAVVNFANPDMVGHTGVIPAAIRACEAADAGLARVVAAVHARGGVAIVTADHGNAERMLTDDGMPHTSHTTSLVPFIVVPASGIDGEPAPIRFNVQGGRLADVAPTVLDLLGLAQPAAMTGSSLLQRA